MKLQALALVALLLAAPFGAAAQTQPWSGPSVLDDPAWQQRFLASYGFLSGAEPEIQEDEREVLRGVVELIKTDPKAAAAQLEPLVGPDSSGAIDFILANAYFQEGDEEAAAKYYRSALEKFPDFRRAHKNLGLLLIQKGELRQAADHLARAVELGDRDGRNFGLLGFAHLNLENYVAAEEAYRNAILQDPDTKDWKLGLARAFLSTEKYRDAVALFDTLIAEDPNDATAWMLQANAYIGLEELLPAATNLETVRMMGKAPNSSLVLLGDIYMKSGMPDLAKEVYLEVIEKDEGAAQFGTAYRAADLLVRTRSFREAQEVLASIDRRYAKGRTKDEELNLLTLKAKVARAQGRDADAAKLLESIVTQDGTRGDALIELGTYYQAQGQDEKAILTLERAEKLEGFEYSALLKNAQIRVAQRDYKKAAELLRRALAIKNEPRVESYLARIEGAIQPE